MAYRPDSQEEAFDYLFKLVLIGDAGVGKTCVVQRFMGSAFVERHSSTIGVDFTMRTVVIDGKRVKVLHAVDIYYNSESSHFLMFFFVAGKSQKLSPKPLVTKLPVAEISCQPNN